MMRVQDDIQTFEVSQSPQIQLQRTAGRIETTEGNKRGRLNQENSKRRRVKLPQRRRSFPSFLTLENFLFLQFSRFFLVPPTLAHNVKNPFMRAFPPLRAVALCERFIRKKKQDYYEKGALPSQNRSTGNIQIYSISISKTRATQAAGWFGYKLIPDAVTVLHVY